MGEIRTLIVDDSSVMRKIVERSLRQAGLELLVVHEAGSGTEGLELLKTKQVDLILSDINMPAMDGLEFLRQVRAQNLAIWLREFPW
jgi:two-component system chemotaxis response regulator CheY